MLGSTANQGEAFGAAQLPSSWLQQPYEGVWSMDFPSWVEIDLDRLHANLDAIQRCTGGRRTLLVVKADAYGHGSVIVASEALKAGVDMLGVATVHEGIQLRRAGLMGPILILSPCLTCEVKEIVRYGLRCTVSHPRILETLGRECEEAGTRLPVHVEIDTGMGRSGVLAQEAQPLLRAIASHPRVLFEGLFTHFPDADSADPGFAERQLVDFRELLGALRKAGLAPEITHAANSAGLLHLPGSHLDMVRPGLLAYGLQPPGARAGDPALPAVAPVMSFRSRLVQIRDLPAGATISYGRTFTAPRPMRIGVVAAGYGHGLDLRLSNCGALLIRGTRVPIVGRVTMDLTMVDLSSVPDAEVEDEVVIFGSSGTAEIGIVEVARWCGTIPYEVICSIGKRVPRVYRCGNETVTITTLLGERRRRAGDEPAVTPIAAPLLRRRAPHSSLS